MNDINAELKLHAECKEIENRINVLIYYSKKNYLKESANE